MKAYHAGSRYQLVQRLSHEHYEFTSLLVEIQIAPGPGHAVVQGFS